MRHERQELRTVAEQSKKEPWTPYLELGKVRAEEPRSGAPLAGSIPGVLTKAMNVPLSRPELPGVTLTGFYDPLTASCYHVPGEEGLSLTWRSTQIRSPHEKMGRSHRSTYHLAPTSSGSSRLLENNIACQTWLCERRYLVLISIDPQTRGSSR